MNGTIKPSAERYDILVMTDQPNRRVADTLAESVIKTYAARRIIIPFDEALHTDWVEVYCKPGGSAHEAFLRGGWDDDEPPFLEVVVRWGDEAVDVVEGGVMKAYFFMEFRGARFQDVGAQFKRIFKDLTFSRPTTMAKPHTGLAPHREVPEDQKRAESKCIKRHGNPAGPAGTHVEEF